MKKLWDIFNDSKFFIYFAVLVLAVIKLSADSLRTNETFLHFSAPLKTIATFIYIAAVSHFILFLLTIAILFLRFDKSYDQWEKDNKGTKVKELLDTLIVKPSLLTLMITAYGFSIYLTLFVFSWREFFIFFGAMVIAKTIRTLYNLNKDRQQQEI